MIQRSVGLALLVTLSAGLASAGAQQNIPTPSDSIPRATICGACLGGPAVGLRATSALVLGDTGRQKAIEYSDAYGVRLKIHQIGSYVILPMFVAEYLVGEKLLTDERNNRNIPNYRPSIKGTHSAIATGLGVVFTSNTVTGVWNLIESRHDPAGRTRRWVHSIAMLIADAGMVMTAQAAGDARETDAGANTHRNLAIGSMGLAAASSIMMWLWKD